MADPNQDAFMHLNNFLARHKVPLHSVIEWSENTPNGLVWHAQLLILGYIYGGRGWTKMLAKNQAAAGALYVLRGSYSGIAN
ncbi:hypothetical protein BOTBODRAFT_55217 [Botryobasidium botryosum FD-172 SS1]|uniref:DRBM domain-containing protein n=1 Tax=Botryobasidium botryosum (strain FD-172 SS1) TaxID=930990 RepID=A0A067MFW1_BOTB1|nr:hypothetical protein BOTBODRAFT_55217 [Botryobasidium botryosum FD-172 SS1]